jgi:hypothetical protein
VNRHFQTESVAVRVALANFYYFVSDLPALLSATRSFSYSKNYTVTSDIRLQAFNGSVRLRSQRDFSSATVIQPVVHVGYSTNLRPLSGSFLFSTLPRATANRKPAAYKLQLTFFFFSLFKISTTFSRVNCNRTKPCCYT